MTNELAIRIITGDVLGTTEQTQEAITMAVKALLLPSAQPDTRSLEQIKWERDIAIQQLKDLGYSLGEKIRTDGDTISRQALMKEFADFVRRSNNSDFAPTPTWNDAVSLVGSMPSAQPEEAISVAWLEEQAKWFESIDNAFAKIEANNIRVMIKKYRREKNE